MKRSIDQHLTEPEAFKAMQAAEKYPGTGLYSKEAGIDIETEKIIYLLYTCSGTPLFTEEERALPAVTEEINAVPRPEPDCHFPFTHS